MSDIVGLLCSYSSVHSTISLSFSERQISSATSAGPSSGCYVFILQECERADTTGANDRVAGDTVNVAPIPWLKGITPSDMFFGFADSMRKAGDNIHYEMHGDMRQFLSVIAAISMTGEFDVRHPS